MLLDNEQKLVELFVDNVIWGNVKVKMSEYSLEKEGDKPIAEQIGTAIRYYKNGIKIPPELQSLLYRFFIIGRFMGYVEGELRNRDEENQLQELKIENDKAGQNIKDLSYNIIKLQGEKKKLHDENIMLANELEDRKNLIESYENSSMKKP